MNKPRSICRTIALVCALVGMSAVARAQSAVDGFHPLAPMQVLTLAVQADGKIVVGGTGIGEGTPPNNLYRLNLDGSFDAGFTPVADNPVIALTVQPDGKILVGGSFGTLWGSTRQGFGRLNSDGTLDGGFNPGTNSAVSASAVLPDGKIVVGGYFTTLGGATHNFIGRLNSDGSVDSSFTASAGSAVAAMVVQPDGKIVVGGYFFTLGGGARAHIGRLNADGSLDTSFDPGAGADGSVTALALQPDGKIVVGGFFSTLNGVARSGIGRLNATGALDTGFNPGVSDQVFAGVNAVVLQPDGKILVGGHFSGLGGGTGSTPRHGFGRLGADGSIDPGFNPGSDGEVDAIAVQADLKIVVGGLVSMPDGGFFIGRLHADGTVDADLDPGANGAVHALAAQPDGKILVGGDFTTLGGGGTGTPMRNRIGRLSADGSLDPTFFPTAQGTVNTLAVQADGKILVGGAFTQMADDTNGTYTRNHIGRLNADTNAGHGLLDLTFDPGANADVYAVALQPDGKILVGGVFGGLGGGTGTEMHNNIGRLNANGSLDTFDPGVDGTVLAVALQPDGKILVGGQFTMLGGGGSGTTPRRHIGRLNPDGSLDQSFDPGADSVVYALAVQADGRILVGGNFTMLGGGGTGTTGRSAIGRLNTGGSLDTTFDPGANNNVYALALQPDGKILVGGLFTTLGGGGTGTPTRNHIGRLNADGSLDPLFDPGADSNVHALAVQADGKILAGGSFTKLGGGGAGVTTRNAVGRLTNTSAAVQRLSVTPSGTSITWSRSGAGPEVSGVTFDSSTDGATYTPLGTGTRVAGGWRLIGQSPPMNQNLYIRARGFYATGYFDGSGSIVESVRNVYFSYQPFTENVLAAGFNLIRAVHITDLRTRIDALRVRWGLLGFGWADLALAAGAPVRAVHLSDLRTALQGAYAAAGASALPPFTDSPVVLGSTFIRAVQIQELRDAVIALEGF